MNKITCICLGVRSMQRAFKFYRDGLGYETDCKEDNPPVTKFELYPLDALARDIDENDLPRGSGFAGITLAYNVKNKEDVDSVIELVKRRAELSSKVAFWGGYHAYFADPDGYYWEVAWGSVLNLTRTGCSNFRSKFLRPRLIRRRRSLCANV